MFSWRSNAVSLHDQLSANTLAYRQGRNARVEAATKEVYPTVKAAVVAYSLTHSTPTYVYRSQDHSVLSNLPVDERDEVLTKVRDIFVNVDGLECHVDGTCIKVIWTLPENSTH